MSSHLARHESESTSTPSWTERLATRQTMRWVAFYAGLVDSDAGERRRGEIASDLWEQASAARAHPPARWVGLSIARRTVAGMAADISWVQLQRARSAPSRSRTSPRHSEFAHGLTRFASRWWWALGALPIALAYLLLARMIWNEPGRPYADQLLLVLPAATSLVVGAALRSWRPRAAAALVVIGTIPGFMAWWAPGLLAAATLVAIGSIAELAQLTTDGRTGRKVALAATVVLTAAMVVPFAVGFGPWWVVLAVAALVVLTLTARRPPLAAVRP